MKKLRIILAAVFAAIAIAPKVAAAPIDMSKYTSETLEETFTAEGLTYDFAHSDYSDSGDKVTMYVFRMDGCGRCGNFYNFVKDSLLAQYADKFKIVSYEIKNNQVNFGLLNQLAEFYNQKSADGGYGTPVVIIGDTMTTGSDSISDARKQEIINIIDSGTDYDVVEEIADGIDNINDSMKTVFSDSGATLMTTMPYYRSHSLRVTPADSSNLGLDRYEYVAAYDIDLMNNGVVVPVSNTQLTISLPVSKAYKSYKVAYVDGGQISEVLDASYNNGVVSFNTSHLSRYAVYGTNDDTSTSTVAQKKVPSAPNSGVATKNEASMAVTNLIALTVMISLGLIYKKSKQY